LIAFGCPITKHDIYLRYAEPGIRNASEPDSVVFANASAGSIYRCYNLLLDQAKELEGLEALVLVHQDVEIVGPGMAEKLRQAFSDPDVGIVGCAGAIGVRSIAWWEGSVTWAAFSHRYEEMGGGEFQAHSYKDEGRPIYAKTGEVDSIDGIFIAMSPRAIRELRFDETLGNLHGYDLDISMQAHEAGMKVVTADIRVIHHHSLELMRDIEGWKDAHMRLAEKWEGRVPGVEAGWAAGDWKKRARRAEAESSAYNTLSTAAGLIRDAELAEMKRALDAYKNSTSWKLTAPARAAGRAIRRMFGASPNGDAPVEPIQPTDL
jgi:hypothetical protein